MECNGTVVTNVPSRESKECLSEGQRAWKRLDQPCRSYQQVSVNWTTSRLVVRPNYKSRFKGNYLCTHHLKSRGYCLTSTSSDSAPSLCIPVIIRVSISLIFTPVSHKLCSLFPEYVAHPRKYQIDTRRDTRARPELPVHHPSRLSHPVDPRVFLLNLRRCVSISLHSHNDQMKNVLG